MGKQPHVLTHPTPTLPFSTPHPPPHLLSLFTVYLITCPTRPGLLARSDAKWLQAKSLEKHQCHFNNGGRNIPLGFSEFMLRTLPIYPAALWELNYCLFQIIIQNVDTQINVKFVCACNVSLIPRTSLGSIMTAIIINCYKLQTDQNHLL